MRAVPTKDEGRHLAATFERDHEELSERERSSERWVGGGFAVAAAIVLVAGLRGPLDPLAAVLTLLVFTVASRVRFDLMFGFTVPTQLAFVPLIFALPVNWTPIAVAACLALARAPDVYRGEMRPSRLVHVLGNSWFAIGPAVVFSVANTSPTDAGPLLLLGALGAQFAGDFCASAVREGIGAGVGIRAQLGETWAYAVDAALTPIALVVGQALEAFPAAALAPLPLLALLAVFARERRQRLEGLLELSNAYNGAALVLGDVVAADDEYTGRHSRSVVELALAVGDVLGVNSRQRRNLEFGALLHDVGKIAIPKEIINKPGKLDPHEWRVVKAHTIEGQRMLEQVGGLMTEVGRAVRSHHERWDGSGYPDGLTAEQIPLESRIISCCDTWNAMRTDRPYRQALSHDAARAEIVRSSGTQLDPRVVAALVTVVDDDRPNDPLESITSRSPGKEALDIRPVPVKKGWPLPMGM